MKRLMLFLTLLFLMPFYFSLMNCTDEGKIGAAIYNGEELKEDDPIPFRLYQNSPNPFNPSTTIRLTLPFEMRVTLKVYTEDWLEIETLIDASRGPGAYSVQFRPASSLPSGEYYYTLEALGYIVVRKMTLMK